MLKKLTATALIGTALVLSACNTVRGAGKDVTSVADCTEDLMKQGKC
jgi:predicted small secreted protein